MAYNGGRVLTYCALGLVFGLVGKTLLLAGLQQSVSIALGIILLAGLLASRKLALWQPVTLGLGHLKQRMGSLLKQRGFTALAILGLLNGLLPCGLVYVACAGATATGGPLEGARYMAEFGLGTVPMMLSISLSGRLVPVAWRFRLRKLVPASVAMLAALLILRGMSLGIPYVSPQLSTPASEGASTPACCHK
jgi:hypothetical protein